MNQIAFGRAICDDLASGERREWLVTNGLGGFASGTIAGTLTRRYHGLLVAALKPPVERTLLVTKIDETARYRGGTYDLYANRWIGDCVSPAGYVSIERFELDGTMPVWHFALADAIVEKRVWMEYGRNTAYVRYRVLRAAAPIELSLRVFGNYRNFHANTHAGNWRFSIERDGEAVMVRAYDGAAPFWIATDRGDVTIENVWYRNYLLTMETRRGLDDLDDNLAIGTIDATLQAGEELTVTASAHSASPLPGALQRRQTRDAQVLGAWDGTPRAAGAPGWMRQCVLAADQFVVTRQFSDDASGLSVIAGYPWFADWGRDTSISLTGLSLMTGRPEIAKSILLAFACFVDGGMVPNCFPPSGETPRAAGAPGWMRQCVLAADQFVVTRQFSNDASGLSVIAGYPWFADWGRDTAISLTGLSLMTGRPEIAKGILLAFARFVDGGMVPNCFPESGETPQYNTADAALWYVEAVARYVAATGDAATLRDLFPVLEAIVSSYRDGTRYDIHMDTDGLIVANAPGQQLTWMDAKVGDRVITPRSGKPVEIAALWYNALLRLAELAPKASRDGAEYAALARKARDGFERFWNEELACCYDVLDGPDGSDATLRPNQLFAIALPRPVLRPERYRTVVDACASQLLTSSGVRTLGPNDPRFTPSYGGPQAERDAAYHQGTAWPWLLGAFVCAHARAYRDVSLARSFLAPLADRLVDYGLGSVSEIADGAAPFRPRGAIAQAWSVGELVRAWFDVEDICREDVSIA